MSRTIHVAFAIGRKGGTHYRARAFVAEPCGEYMTRHSFAVALDDCRETAEAEAVEHVRAMYRRDGIEPPEAVERHGKIPGAMLDSHLFGPRFGALA